MVGLISGVRKNSLAADAGIKAGEKLCSVDGVQVKDIIELSFYTSDYEVDLEIEATDGTRRQVHIEKYPDEDLGLEFDSAVFDRVATCYNNCVFCFVDQMIPGMRPGLYVRDDDYRLSFLYGNFITLTNMKDEDFERIIRTHLTPLYVSVHATDPQVRCQMMHNRFAGQLMERLQLLFDAGIQVHTQIVCCPGYNDGEILAKSFHDLYAQYPNVLTMAVVPVGTTKHREHLTQLATFTKKQAAEVVEQVTAWQERCRKETGKTFIYLGDEFYLLAEKPFAGVNGSGKHNNWSMSTTHENLLDPGDTPMENLQFLVFLAAVIKAVDEYADLLRTSVATPGNDHRLGANEAPPAIISIFVGEELEAVIDAIASDSPYAGPVKMKMDLGVDVLPKFSKDTTDRNRTSPFAFTGNKFEFRMPGSAENLSDCNTILNTAVAKELKGYADELEKADDFTSAAIALVKRTIRDHRRVIFNGNGYTAEWEEEAAKRGLPNKKNTPAALPALIEPKNIALMEDFGVLTKVEMESRYEVEMEHYSKIINIEALTMLEMARKQLLPAINAYMSEVANTAASKLAVSESLSVRSETKALTRLSADADAMSDAVDELQAAVDAAKALSDESAKAVAFHDDVLPKMDALRAAADDAETICGEDYWPLPSYSKMLYYV